MKYLAILASLFLATPALALNASSIRQVVLIKAPIAAQAPQADDEIAAYIGSDNTTYDITAEDILDVIKAKARAAHLQEIVLNSADSCAYVTENSRLRCTVANPALVRDIARIPASYLNTAKALGSLEFWNIR